MIIFIGVAGSGKSIQGRMLADHMGLSWLSTGEFLRMLITGNRRKDMLNGKLLGDNEIIALVQRIFGIINTKDDFVLDGFPRTVPQVDWLLSQVKHGQLDITAVIHLKASEESVRKRLIKRGRQDDTKAAIKERFIEYNKVTLPILEHFKQANITVYDIDAQQSVDDVQLSIRKAIGG